MADQISAGDIADWDSLDDIAASFEKRGLKRYDGLDAENKLALQIDDGEFIVLVEAGAGESANDFKPENRARRTNLVATNDYESFTFLTRIRSWEGQQHGRIKHQKLSFTKEQMTSDSGQKNTVLQKLNSIEYGNPDTVVDTLYDTKQVVKEFYEDFEKLRTDLVQEVAGIPDDRGDAKQRYVQIVLDRMIFLYFIQEKRLLDRNRSYLHDKHEDVVEDEGDVYADFYHPLFFEMLAEGVDRGDFGSLPYLNGGLFSKNPVEEEFEDARLGETTERTNELFGDILDFLSDWNWNVDERLDIVDPKNLSPAILGHIFEQTVNQKEMGAYYTPEEITGFMARRTIHPYLLDQLNDAVGADYEDIDEVFALDDIESGDASEALADGGAITAQAPTDSVDTNHVETLYHDVLTEMSVLDPAVGSGAFLLAAQEILLDIYLQCIEYFQHLTDTGHGWELTSKTRDELEAINSSSGGPSLYAKRSIILNNLYGVDIDDGAVEICKLRLWLSMVADIEDEPNEVEPLPNIDFNIRQGNSLIGFSDFIEIDNQGNKPLSNWGEGVGTGVRELFEDVIEAIDSYNTAKDPESRRDARYLAESRIDSHADSLDEKVLEEFHEAGLSSLGIEDIREFDPFHWVLEFAPVYDTGGFDIVIGNPPWEVLTSNREDYFTQFDPIFRTRGKSDKDSKQEELLKNTAIENGWEEHQDQMQTLSTYFTNGSSFSLQSPEVGGHGKHDLSALFMERVLDLVGDQGYVSQIIPGRNFIGTSGKDLRTHLLSDTSIEHIVSFENHGIFEDIDNRYNFGIVTLQNFGSTDYLRGIFKQHDLEVLSSFDSSSFNISSEILLEYSPTVRLFPQIDSETEIGIIQSIIQFPPLSEKQQENWYIDIYKEELNQTRDRDRFVENQQEGDYPVYGGENIYMFSYDSTFFEDINSPSLWSVDESKDQEISAKYRIREKNLRSLKKSLYQEFEGTGSQIGFVNSLLEDHGRGELNEEDVLLDCTEYRIGFRHISRATDERSFIATVLPKGVVCYEKVPVVRPYKIKPALEDLGDSPLHSVYERVFSDEELFAAVGLLNSICFDYLVRTKLDTSMSKYVIEESQLPRLTEGDALFKYISHRAARLNCYGKEFAEMRERLGGINPATNTEERRDVQAELDAAAFHAYELSRQEVEYILNDFHRVSNPRIMTEDYFERVIEKFDSLSNQAQNP
ncbi:Eco57I restriction-modification methylase domain-containing protein [Halorubellus litoreus]|uniref:site-specific DNA-methyltransferase (adenine-specific) n=1 Tax=Halorubellus litoreus TaxID=755308 RepID=A0ABD5VNZ9_9EURY